MSSPDVSGLGMTRLGGASFPQIGGRVSICGKLTMFAAFEFSTNRNPSPYLWKTPAAREKNGRPGLGRPFGVKPSSRRLERQSHAELDDAVRVRANSSDLAEVRLGLRAGREVELRGRPDAGVLRRVRQVVELRLEAQRP